MTGRLPRSAAGAPPLAAEPISWWQRARAGTLPTRVIGGAPRPALVACPDCPEAFEEPLTLLAHLAWHARRAA